MGEAIISAIIGGIFSLIRTWYKHRLEARSAGGGNVSNERSNDLSRGCLLLLVDFVVIVIFIDLFDLGNNRPVWAGFFSFITLILIPFYAGFRIIRGMFSFFTN